MEECKSGFRSTMLSYVGAGSISLPSHEAPKLLVSLPLLFEPGRRIEGDSEFSWVRTAKLVSRNLRWRQLKWTVRLRSHNVPNQTYTTTQHEEVIDRKSTRLNSSHLGISYAVFCLQKTD